MNRQVDNSSNQNSQTLKDFMNNNPLFSLFLLACLILMILLFLYLIEKIIFIILTTITFTPLISFPLLIVLHLLLIRYIVIQIAFTGQNMFASRAIEYNIGRMQANQILKVLKLFHDLLSIFDDIRGLVITLKELNDLKRQITIIQRSINYFIDIYNKMKNKYHELTIDQQLFYNNILLFNTSLNNENFLSFIKNTIDTINKHDSQFLSDLPEEEKNKITAECFNRKVDIQNLLMLSHGIMDQIIDYIGDNSLSQRNIRNYFKNKLFGSIEQFQVELSNFYNFEEKKLITTDSCQLEYIIIRENISVPKKKLMIICGPNGVPYQIFAKNFRFEKYLEYNMDILFWNYRGYGFSKGKPSYTKLRTDVLELFDEVKRSYNYEKFAVQGISIGGIPSIHLASNRKEIELLICDRNFGRLDNIVQSFPCGKYLSYLYKILLFQSTDNVDNYLKSSCYKIVLNDPKDTIVLETCSLKTLISSKLCEKYLCCYHEDNNNFNNSIISTHNNELEILSKKNLSISNNQNIPLTTVNDKISVNDNNVYNKSKKILIKRTALDKIFNSVEEKKNFINVLIELSNILKNNKLEVNKGGNFFTKITGKFKKNSQYLNLKEEDLKSTNWIFDFVKRNIHEIFESIESTGDTLLSLITIKRDYTKEIFIDNFFNNMFIWGSKLSDDISEYYENPTKNIKYILNEAIKKFDDFLNSQEIVNNKELPLVKCIDIIYKYFSQIQNNLKNIGLQSKDGLVKLINEDLIDSSNTSSEYDYEQYLMKLNRGHLIPLSCGHNGALSTEESELFLRFLMKSHYFNDQLRNNQNNEEQIKIDDDINENRDTNSLGSDKNINNLI